MSFSGEIRSELSRRIGGARHCQLAEFYAMTYYSGSALPDGPGADAFVFRTDSAPAAEKYFRLLKKLFGGSPELEVKKGRRKGTHRYNVIERNPDTIRKIAEANAHPVFRRECCRRAFIRGAFLVCGSVSDPNRSYHFEMVCQDDERAETLKNTINEEGLHARTVRRRNDIVVYIKEIDEISDLLGMMGSRTGLMKLENVRILKEMRGNVNRKVNCETANISKTVSAAVRQTEDIRLIEEKIGLCSLPNGLDEMARLRIQYPEGSLQELGEKLDPPVGKSGVNHRLRRLGKIAAKLREEMEGEKNGQTKCDC